MQNQPRIENERYSLEQRMCSTASGRLVLTIPFLHYFDRMLAALVGNVYGYWNLSGRAKRNCLCVVSSKRISLLSHFTGSLNPRDSQPNHLTTLKLGCGRGH